MSNNTNTLFWVITGSVVILSTFLLFQNGGNETVSEITKSFGDMFNSGITLSQHYGHEKNYNNLKITDESLFSFDEATQTITEYLGTDTDVVFPYEINGVEVKAIGRLGLADKRSYAVDCEWLQEYYRTAEEEERVWLDEELTRFEEMGILKDGVCQYPPQLTSVVIPDTVEEIQDYAFCNNKELKSVTLSKSIKRLGECAFGDNQIESINLDELTNLTYIGGSAFVYNKLSGEIVIPDSVTFVGEFAFTSNDIDHAIISKNLEFLSKYTFSYNRNMKYVIFRNPKMNVADKVYNSDTIFDKDSSFIVKVPKGSKSWYSNFPTLSNYRIEEY